MKQIVFSGNPLDRAEPRRRDAAWLRERLADDATRVLPVWKLSPLVRTGDAPRLAWATPALLDGRDGHAEPVFLGVADGVAHFAADLSDRPEPLDRVRLRRASRTSPSCARSRACCRPATPAIAAQARQIVDWHARHGFCPGCGERTRPKNGGWSRRCAACSTEHFPRTDPVVIMLVTDGERCVLGRQSAWPRPFFSALAGFVEAGETLEEAVRREVAEEVGVTVDERALPGLAALAVPRLADARLHGARDHARDPGRSLRARGGRLVHARRGARRARRADPAPRRPAADGDRSPPDPGVDGARGADAAGPRLRPRRTRSARRPRPA